jgi:aryl sulfotransferase
MTLTRRVYQSHSLDSTRWKSFRPRPDDIVVVSSYKSGTTWVQVIALRLLLGNTPTQVTPELAPLEAPFEPIAAVLRRVEQQSHPRLLKTHLPLDGLEFYDSVKYIVICRDARDVFMSLWNHYTHLIRYPFFAASVHPTRHGPPLPKPPADIRQFWFDWMTKGWFNWEREGYPFWSNLRHTNTWWSVRSEHNILFLHFNDLLNNTADEIRRLADFLNVPVDATRISDLVKSTSFESMCSEANALLPAAQRIFRGGARTFFHCGTNGRWRPILTDEDLLLYSQVATSELSETCRAWLEVGRAACDPEHQR